MKPDSVLAMLGIAAKSGNILSGEFSVEKAVREKKAYLIIIAEDASDNTKKKFQNMTNFYKVPMYLYSDKVSLGHHIGKEFRASVAVINQSLARSIEDKIEQTITTE